MSGKCNTVIGGMTSCKEVKCPSFEWSHVEKGPLTAEFFSIFPKNREIGGLPTGSQVV